MKVENLAVEIASLSNDSILKLVEQRINIFPARADKRADTITAVTQDQIRVIETELGLPN